MKASGTVSRDSGYLSRGYSIVRGLLGPDVVEYLKTYAGIVRETGRFEADHQVPGSLRRYGAPGFDALLTLCAPTLSIVSGRSLEPTYSFARYYFKGQELVAHRDRAECEHSATIHVASEPNKPWPIWIRADGEEPLEVVLYAGDALLYRGNEVLHWREPLEADWYMQVFLHYVDGDGPNAHLRLDGRAQLGEDAKR